MAGYLPSNSSGGYSAPENGKGRVDRSFGYRRSGMVPEGQISFGWWEVGHKGTPTLQMVGIEATQQGGLRVKDCG